MMKKILGAAMAALLALSFAGCGASAATAAGSGAPGTDESWSKARSAGQLVLGLDKAFPPMGFVDPKTGELTGFDVDTAREACKRLGVTLKLQPIDWNNKQSELNNGNVDCLWNGFSKTEKRDKEFSLSIPYMKNNQIILVKSGSSYKGLASLAGKSVGVQSDSSAETALKDNAEFTDKLKEVVKIDDYSKAVMEIQNGTVDAVAIDEVVARYYLTQKAGAYAVLQDENGKDASLAVEDYVVGFRKGDEALRAKVEGALKEMSADGMLAEISEKWFGKDVTTVAK